MQTAKILPFHNTQTVTTPKQAAPAEWIYPGKVIPLNSHISMGIAYDQVNGEYVPRFKFWHDFQRIKDIHLNPNRQIDLRTSCQLIITQLAVKHSPAGRPLKTLITIEPAPYSWNQPTSDNH